MLDLVLEDVFLVLDTVPLVFLWFWKMFLWCWKMFLWFWKMFLWFWKMFLWCWRMFLWKTSQKDRSSYSRGWFNRHSYIGLMQISKSFLHQNLLLIRCMRCAYMKVLAVLWLIVRAFPSWNGAASCFLLFLGVYKLAPDNYWKHSIGKSSKFELVRSLHIYLGWQIVPYSWQAHD